MRLSAARRVFDIHCAPAYSRSWRLPLQWLCTVPFLHGAFPRSILECSGSVLLRFHPTGAGFSRATFRYLLTHPINHFSLFDYGTQNQACLQIFSMNTGRAPLDQFAFGTTADSLTILVISCFHAPHRTIQNSNFGISRLNRKFFFRD